MAKKSIETGIIGEHLVIAKLLELGWIVAGTEKNTESVDVLACNPKTMKTVAIQVKANTTRNLVWRMNPKNEKLEAHNLFYVLVMLSDLPRYFIIKSKDVANYVYNSHKKWLETPGKKGQPHKDTDVRAFKILKEDEKQYENAWSVLNGVNMSAKILPPSAGFRHDAATL